MVSAAYFYVLSFDSTSYAMAAEKVLGQYFNITVIPTPREITQNCGISLKLNDGDLKKITDRIAAMAIPCTLYRLAGGAKTPRALEEIRSFA